MMREHARQRSKAWLASDSDAMPPLDGLRVHEALAEVYGSDLGTRMMYSSGILEVHVLVLALEHTYQACKWLVPALSDEGRQAAKRFRRAWKDVRHVRHALEHEEEYLAGRGENPEKYVGEGWEPAPLITRQVYAIGGEVGIELLGKRWEIGESIEACIALRPVFSREQGVLPAPPDVATGT